MEEIIKQLLSEKRFRHSIEVANLARDMARRLGADEEKAYLAGLVHDIAKELSREEIAVFSKKHGIVLDSLEKNNTALSHGPVGAVMIREYGIEDLEIENAVRYHTVGRAGMSLLEKIIYLADMIEPSRSYKEADELRDLASKDFNEAFRRAVKYSLLWNIEKERMVHEGTLRAWNSILEEGRQN